MAAFAVVVRRKYDPVNSLGVAAILQCLNPYAVGDVGMLLSYSAVLGLLILFPILHKYFAEKLKYDEFLKSYFASKNPTVKMKLTFYGYKVLFYALDLFLLSFSAVVFVTPVTILYFGTVTPAGIIITAIISLPVNILLICTLLCSVLWYVPLISAVTYPLAFIAYYLAEFVIFVIETASSWGLTAFYIDSTLFGIWFVITVAVAVIIAYIKFKPKSAIPFVSVSVVFFFVINIMLSILAFDNISLVAYPCGKGITVTVEKGSYIDVVSCGGESKYRNDILKQLQKCKGNINSLLIPSTKNAEMGFADDILREFDADSVMLYYINNTKDEVYTLAKECNNYYEFTTGEICEIKLSGKLTDVVFNVDNHTYQYIYNDEISVLIIPTYGDCEEIPEEYRSADVVVMCEEPENIDLLEYGTVLWSSEEDFSDNLENVITIKDEPIDLLSEVVYG